MTLTLTVLRCPDAASAETRQLAGGTLSIGRAPENDWVLADPERHLSKRHCIIALRGAAWELADLSANGTYLNRDPEPIGSGRARDLRDGDRLKLGAYEIEVRIAETARPAPALPFADRFDDPPLQSTPGFRAELPYRAEPALPGALDLALPADLFALPPQPDDAPVQHDHTPAVEEAFRPPRPVVLLGDDWDLDGSRAERPAPPAPPPVLAAATVPEPPPAAGAGADLLAAFLRGAGLSDIRPANPDATMEALGAAFRALAGGLREALITRAAVKGEFRIAQTMIRAQGNNPLKFAASEDDALLALLGVGRRAEMGPAESVAEAMRDIRLHELATMSAMQSAIRSLLRDFAPAKLREEAAQGGRNLLPSQGKLRAWDLFEAQHAKLTQALSDDFDSAFGRAFARAYEQALREAQSGRTPA